MCSAERLRFSEMISNNSGLFYGMLSKIDASRSEAFKITDKNQIFSVVEKTIGFNRLNALVIGCLRKWFVETLEKALRLTPSASSSFPRLLRSLGDIFLDQGLYLDAERCYCELLSNNQINNVVHLDATRMLGIVSLKLGKFDEAVLKLSECCSMYKIGTQVNTKVGYIEAQLNLVDAYFQQYKYVEARSVLADIDTFLIPLIGSSLELNFDHPLHDQFYDLMRKKAFVSMKYDQTQESVFSFEYILSHFKDQLGDNHPETLQSTLDLSYCMAYFHTSDTELFKAVGFIEDCVQKLCIKLGNGNPLTIKATYQLGSIYLQYAKTSTVSQNWFSNTYYEMAYEKHSQAHSESIKTFGDTHIETARILKTIQRWSAGRVTAVTVVIISVLLMSLFFYLELSIIHNFSNGTNDYTSSDLTFYCSMSWAPLFMLMSMSLTKETDSKSDRVKEGFSSLDFSLRIIIGIIGFSWMIVALVMSIWAMVKIVNRNGHYNGLWALMFFFLMQLIPAIFGMTFYHVIRVTIRYSMPKGEDCLSHDKRVTENNLNTNQANKSEATTWSCPACTFLNHTESLSCIVCQASQTLTENLL